jgi:hypothetical protein
MPFGTVKGLGATTYGLPSGALATQGFPSPISPAQVPAGALNPNGFPSPAAVPIQTGVIVPGTGATSGLNWITQLLNTPTAQIAARNLTSTAAQQQALANQQNMPTLLLIGAGLLLVIMMAKRGH